MRPLTERLMHGCRHYAVLLFLAVAYLAIGVFDHGIWAPTEPAVAGVVTDMIHSDDLAVPRINGYPYLEKPPLYYWLAWVAGKTAGTLSPGLVRLPATVLGLLALLSVYLASRRHFGEAIAHIATLLTATTGVFYLMTHRASADSAVIFFVFAGFALFIRTLAHATVPPGEQARQALRLHWNDLLLAVLLALSFYAKNFLVDLIVVPSILLYLLWHGAYRRVALFVGALIAFTALALTPWIAALHAEGGWLYVRIVFIDNTLGRFLSLPTLAGLPQTALNDAYFVHKNQSFYYYLHVLLTLTAPWTLLFIAALVSLLRRWRSSELRRFLLLSLITVMVCLSLSSSKSDNYLNGLLIIPVLIVADFLHALLHTGPAKTHWHRLALGANLALLILGFLAVGIYGWHRFSDTHLLIWALLTGTAAAALAWRHSPWQADAAGVRAWFVFLAAGWFAMATLSLPHVDAAKSPARFLAQVRSAGNQRPLYTLLVDDRSLPLLTFGLDQRLPELRNARSAITLLKGTQPVGILLPGDFYARHRDALKGMALTQIRWHDKISYLANRAMGVTPVHLAANHTALLPQPRARTHGVHRGQRGHRRI